VPEAAVKAALVAAVKAVATIGEFAPVTVTFCRLPTGS
jgi:hypothetical protein